MRALSMHEITPGPRRYGDWLLLLSSAAVIVLVFWRLALTDLIIGRGDLFFYFYPYRDYASQSILNGRVPLWNPHLFMGVPFFANSQAGVLYPLNLLVAGLPVARQVNFSLVVHAVLAGCGTYLWARTRLRLGRSGSFLSTLVFAAGGYLVAQIEHLNQFQVLVWLPWLLWIYDAPRVRGSSLLANLRASLTRIGAMAIVFTLQVLAGHMQSVFICFLGLAAYALLPLVWRKLRRRDVGASLALSAAVLLAAIGSAALLAAVQLLPTFELSRLSVRSGGLDLNEAVSFSLSPDLLPRALLPSWGKAVFAEYIAYIGVVGLGLALFGIWAVVRMEQQSSTELIHGDSVDAALTQREEHARLGALVLALVGLFLALGGFNPVYVLLVKVIPGFASFRAPARWLVLYAVGMAGLVGIGSDTITDHLVRISAQKRPSCRRILIFGFGVLGVAVLWALLGERLAPDRHRDLVPPLEMATILSWFVAATAFGLIVCAWFVSQRADSRRALKSVLVSLVVLELFAASVYLPLNRATAPGALTSLRPAVAHLLTAADEVGQTPPARFLSISDILFDPGDKDDLEIILDPQLSRDAVYDFLIATKQKEVLIPNLPLYYRLPAMDGYDGGILPLKRYVVLEQLYLPEGEIAFDGRLREYLEAIPDGRWLSLFNVRYIITDKVGDAWYDDVFFDMQMGAMLVDADEATAGEVPHMRATALGVVYDADAPDAGARVATFFLTFDDGETVALPLLADQAPETPDGTTVARLSWDRPERVSGIRVVADPESGRVDVRAISLIDERTGAFIPVTFSDSGRFRLVHSGDVKIYENLDVQPRANFVPNALVARDDDEALALMRDPAFDPASMVVLSGDGAAQDTAFLNPDTYPAAGGHASTEIIDYEPERIVVGIDAESDGWLVLSDAWYPGWQASLDGATVPVERANVLFRAVRVPKGEHQIEWVFRPTTVRYGAFVSLGSALLMVSIGVVIWNRAKAN
jgi:hypothetical protein